MERHTESFLQEAATLQKVNHPNVLRFYGVVVDSDAAQSVVGIITEYLPDGSLSAFLRRAEPLSFLEDGRGCCTDQRVSWQAHEV